MTSSEKCLNSLTPRLTVRARVVLTLQLWLADGRRDKRLSQKCAEHERQEMERLISAIERGNDQLGSAIAFNTEWAHTEEITFAWLECLQGFLAREQHQRSSPAQKLPPLPKPERAIGAQTTLGEVNNESFNHLMIDLGVNGGVVLALAVALFLFSRRLRSEVGDSLLGVAPNSQN